MQLYSKKPSELQMQPRQETIQFLINFSKSLTIVKIKSENFIELNLN
jgi:heme-binding NEAT domain protein